MGDVAVGAKHDAARADGSGGLYLLFMSASGTQPPLPPPPPSPPPSLPSPPPPPPPSPPSPPLLRDEGRVKPLKGQGSGDGGVLANAVASSITGTEDATGFAMGSTQVALIIMGGLALLWCLYYLLFVRKGPLDAFVGMPLRALRSVHGGVGIHGPTPARLEYRSQRAGASARRARQAPPPELLLSAADALDADAALSADAALAGAMAMDDHEADVNAGLVRYLPNAPGRTAYGDNCSENGAAGGSPGLGSNAGSVPMPYAANYEGGGAGGTQVRYAANYDGGQARGYDVDAAGSSMATPLLGTPGQGSSGAPGMASPAEPSIPYMVNVPPEKYSQAAGSSGAGAAAREEAAAAERMVALEDISYLPNVPVVPSVGLEALGGGAGGGGGGYGGPDDAAGGGGGGIEYLPNVPVVRVGEADGGIGTGDVDLSVDLSGGDSTWGASTWGVINAAPASPGELREEPGGSGAGMPEGGDLVALLQQAVGEGAGGGEAAGSEVPYLMNYGASQGEAPAAPSQIYRM